MEGLMQDLRYAWRSIIGNPGFAAAVILTLGLGIGVGALVSAGLVRFLKAMLYDMSALDPATFAAVCGVLILVALAACYLPSRRATRVDPLAALRCE
jgi:putative ABC transport system permease protein